ncbi:MAG: hypothetical protein OEQ25_02895 [Gammaproteobacteria bacterium]|nr:hypothetical protein [Gammaproteobacteria bacterium]MDH3506062.1 hypothetical protein [Gammaproteobacteria bacterium]
MEASNTGIFSFSHAGSYIETISAENAEMSLLDRSNLIYLDKCLHKQWRLGQNVILNWCPTSDGVAVLVVPHYAVAANSAQAQASRAPLANHESVKPSEDFFKSLITGRRRLTPRQMDNVARLLGIEQTQLKLRQKIDDSPTTDQIIEKLVKRYGISYVDRRAVALFDIVGFSLLTPFEQMTQLNSLSYSINSAHSKMLSKSIDIDFGRSTTGDGFYLWNRGLGLEADILLYHLMHLVLADNAIAKSKAQHNTVPELRACFHVGGSYEFHQAEGLNPTLYNYIVGDVTIELARMIERALPGQIMVGEFLSDTANVDANGDLARPDSVEFVEQATHSLDQLSGLELSGEKVESIKCYLTGTQLRTGDFSIRRITISDKHGISRNVFNAKVNIYRRHADPILLGIEDRLLSAEATLAEKTAHLVKRS